MTAEREGRRIAVLFLQPRRYVGFGCQGRTATILPQERGCMGFGDSVDECEISRRHRVSNPDPFSS